MKRESFEPMQKYIVREAECYEYFMSALERLKEDAREKKTKKRAHLRRIAEEAAAAAENGENEETPEWEDVADEMEPMGLASDPGKPTARQVE